MDIQFTGKIIAAEPYQQGTSQRGTQWCSQDYVIEELNQQYPSRAVFRVYGSDRLQQFSLQAGEIVTVHLSPKANQSKEGRWFNQLDCWKVERPNVQQPQPQPMQGYAQPQPYAQQPQQQPYAQPAPPANGQQDKLPF